MSLIHNERTKLSAATLNGVALTSIAAGFVTPLAALSFAIPGAGARGVILTVLSAVAWLVLGLILHWVARGLLGRLIE